MFGWDTLKRNHIYTLVDLRPGMPGLDNLNNPYNPTFV